MAEGFSMPASLRAISALSLSPSAPLADGGGDGGGVSGGGAMARVPKSTTKLVDWQKLKKKHPLYTTGQNSQTFFV
jgi:hypothetical protein